MFGGRGLQGFLAGQVGLAHAAHGEGHAASQQQGCPAVDWCPRFVSATATDTAIATATATAFASVEDSGMRVERYHREEESDSDGR